jgi:hypothetical protein
MMKLTIALLFAFLSTTVVYAETYNYSCKVCVFPFPTFGYDCEVDGKTYPLRVDDNKNVLEWRGKKYSISNANDPDKIVCANAGWHAEGNGTSFTFCAATQGYAAIEDKDGNDLVECCERRGKCNLKR